MLPRTLSKRPRANSEANPSTAAAPRFRSPAHEERYATFFTGREVVKEKGFLLTPDSCEEIETCIQSHWWKKLCEPSRTSCPALVKEFYANAWDDSGAEPTWRSMVRGKEVPFDHNKTIQVLMLF